MTRMFSAIRVLRACALAMLLSTAGHAFNTIAVTVTVDAANTFGACWDDWCGKPDLFVTFYGHSLSWGPACMGSSVPDRIYVSSPAPADWSCTTTIERNGKLYIALYDGDGPNGSNSQAQQVDVAPGAERSIAVDVESIAARPGTPFTLTSFGHDGTITYTVSAKIIPETLTPMVLGFRKEAAGERGMRRVAVQVR